MCMPVATSDFAAPQDLHAIMRTHSLSARRTVIIQITKYKPNQAHIQTQTQPARAHNLLYTPTGGVMSSLATPTLHSAVAGRTALGERCARSGTAFARLIRPPSLAMITRGWEPKVEHFLCCLSYEYLKTTVKSGENFPPGETIFWAIP